MEIIKQGNVNKLTEDVKFTYKFECDNCGCVFKCTIEELHSIERRLGGKRTAICPCCGKELEYYKSDFI